MKARGRPTAEKAPRIYRVAQLLVTRLWKWNGGSVRIEGLENLPETGPALVLCNHLSYIDPILLQAHVRRPIYSLAKSTSFSPAGPMVAERT